jgi:2-octaprenyl-6-methoxyphenol hydroxylase
MNARMDFDCIVVGGGPTGLAAATALAARGIATALASGPPSPAARAVGTAPALETRTAALFPPSVALLEKLGVWAGIKDRCAAVKGIRLVDDTGNLLRAPEVVFRASDIDRDDLGYNVPNSVLAAQLTETAPRVGVAVLDGGQVNSAEFNGDGASVVLCGGRRVTARLLIAADGRGSITREAAGIPIRRTTYDQHALACGFKHSRPHGGISTELHGASGPCTTVPLPDLASSLVWMHKPEEVRVLLEMPEAQFLQRLSERLGGLLGTLSGLAPRRAFELVGLVAECMGRSRVALVGEAAHAFPPIGAQGLNLGLADVAALVDLIVQAHQAGGDIGSPRLLSAYDIARKTEVQRRAGAVDLLNRSLQPGIWPLGLARGAGLHVLAASSALRRRLMLEGLYPPRPLPSLMAERANAKVDGDAARD